MISTDSLLRCPPSPIFLFNQTGFYARDRDHARAISGAVTVQTFENEAFEYRADQVGRGGMHGAGGELEGEDGSMRVELTQLLAGL